MAGPKDNIVRYVFEGDTLELEKAVKRVKDLLESSTTSLLKTQKGVLTKSQQQLISSTKKLASFLEKRVPYAKSLTSTEAKRTSLAGRQALANAKKLRDNAIAQEDRADLKEQKKKELLAARAAASKAKIEQKQQERVAAAVSLPGQVTAGSEADQLSRLAIYTKDRVDPRAAGEIQKVVKQYKEANDLFNRGAITQAELGKATLALDDTYKSYATTLGKVSKLKEQEIRNGKQGTTFAGYIWSKAKSLAVYRSLRAFMVLIVKQIQQMFGEIAEKSQTFNRTIATAIASFKYLIGSIATVMAPILQIVTPAFQILAEAIGNVFDQLSELFNALAGNDTWVKATIQVNSFTDALSKTSQVKGIDEINRLNEEDNIFSVEAVSSNFQGLIGFATPLKELLAEIFGLVKDVIDVASQLPIDIITSAVAALVSVLATIKPILTFIVATISGILTTVVSPILAFINTLISNIWLLAAAFVVLNLAQLAYTGSAKSMIAVKIAQWIAANTVSIWKNVTALIAQAAATIKAKIASIAMAIANWWEAASWWQKAIAIIAAAGALAIIVAAVVLTAVGTATAASTNTQNSGKTNPVPGGVAALAAGGVVASPTLALIGEGTNSEAVVPLGNSPQFESMKQGIAQEVVSNLDNTQTGSDGSGTVILQIDGKELARAIWPSLAKTYRQVGVEIK